MEDEKDVDDIEIVEEKELKFGQGTSNALTTFINAFKSYLGVGVLGLPYAWRLSGLWPAAVGYCLVSCISWIGIFILLSVKKRLAVLADEAESRETREEATQLQEEGVGTVDAWSEVFVRRMSGDDRARRKLSTFSDVGYVVFGRAGIVAIDLTLISSQLGFAVVYVIFCGENMHSLVPALPSPAWMAVFLPIFVVLSMVRSLRLLAPMSIVSIALMLAGFASVLALCVSESTSGFPSSSIEHFSSSLLHYPVFLSLVIYAYEGIGMVLPLEIAARNKRAFPFVYSAAYVLVTVVYVGFGCLGYLIFGTDTDQIILLNLSASETWVKACISAVRAAFVVSAVLTFPLWLFPVSERIDYLLLRPTTRMLELWRSLLRAALVVIVVALAAAIPEFSLVTAFIGAICSTSLSYVVPAAFDLRVSAWPPNNPRRAALFARDALLLVIGVSSATLCFSITTYQLIDKLISRYR